MSLKTLTNPEELIQLGWGAFIDSHPQATVFQSPEMYELFSRTGNMKPVVVGVVDSASGKILGLVLAVVIREMKGPAGYFSSRAVIYGGPVVVTVGQLDGWTVGQGEEGKILDLLLKELIRQVKNTSVFIQFRNFSSQEENMGIFSASGFRYRERLNLIVDTASRETVLQNMSESRWRQVRKSLKLGACTVEPDSLEQVRDFYDILFDLYKYKVKKPLPAWDFFEQFYLLSKQGKVGIIRLVKYENKIIGGILAPVTPGKTIYEWYVCGLDHEYKEVHPSVLATWAAIEYALHNNIPRFDFMGVGIPEREYGVREFKSRFGGEMVNYGRFARVNNKLLYLTAEAGYNLLVMLKKL